MSTWHYRIRSGKKGTAAEHARYISREGKYSDREDLVESGFGNMPASANGDPIVFWRAADKHERSNGSVYREDILALPNELTPKQQSKLVPGLLKVFVGEKPYQFAVHAPRSSLAGVTNTHVHIMHSDRMPDGIDRPLEKMFARFNAKHPESGGCKKDSGGKGPLRLRDDLIDRKKMGADAINEALAEAGHDARVDHRSLKQQGIERKPERHLGAAKIRKMSSAERKQYDAARLARRGSGHLGG
jgi:hypothetical protein